MHKHSLTKTTKTALVNKSEIAAAVAMVGTLVLPKIVKGSGKFVMTAISAAEIVGCEPTEIEYKGKTYTGAKCYTVHGDYFKTLVDPSSLVLAQAQAKTAPTALVTMESCVGYLPGYSESVKALPKFNG